MEEEGQPFRLNRRTKLTAAGVAAAVLLAGACFLRSSGAALWSEFQAEVEKNREMRPLVQPAPAAPAEREITTGPAPVAVAISSFIFLGGDPPVQEAPPAARAPLAAELRAEPAPSPPDSPGSRSVYGVVYDLKTLRPLADVKITFIMNGVDAWTASTDALGHYLFLLDKSIPSNAVKASIAAPGYRPGLLEDEGLFRERTREARAMLIEDMVDGDLGPVHLRYADNSSAVELDIALIPLDKK